jgi:hypothetical protein
MTDPIPFTALSIPDKRDQLEQLIAQRERLQKQIDQLDHQIQQSTNLDNARLRRVKPRLSNPGPLRQFVFTALKKHKKGLTLPEIVAHVLEAGYRSQSAHFPNIVYQCLYHTPHIDHDANTRRYSLKKV